MIRPVIVVLTRMRTIRIASVLNLFCVCDGITLRAVILPQSKLLAKANTQCTPRSKALRQSVFRSRILKVMGWNRVPAAARDCESLNPVPKHVGYAQVSSDEQITALKLDALQKAGCAEIFQDTIAGRSRERAGLSAALSSLCSEDTLVVWRLDRLGRSLSHLLELLETLRAGGICLQSLSKAIETSTPAGKLVYSIFGAIAEFESELIRERVTAGLQAAKRRGERIGRRPALTLWQQALLADL